MAQRTIDPARWCPDCKRAFSRRVGVDVYEPEGTRRNKARSARCRRCTLVYKRRWNLARLPKKPPEPLKPGQRCPECEGLAHRRPLSGCPRCKRGYVPLPPVAPVLRKFDWAV